MIINRTTSALVSKNKSEIISLLKSTRRKGISQLIDWLENSDYFYVSGSSNPNNNRGHDNFEGGLAKHSLDVCRIALDLYNGEGLKKSTGNIKRDSIIISCLLHDICKVNREKYDNIEGHGSKSLEILDSLRLIVLSDSERDAIRYHMGIHYDPSDTSGMKEAIKRSKLVFLVHMADTISAVMNTEF